MTSAKPLPAVEVERTPFWYKDAIVYEVHVRTFYDSNGDGIGDFRGLTEKLDYLKDLGVTALWLLPFYPSPLRDEGYDIADYLDIHPSYGTLRDFRLFLREAQRRGLRVITEIVANHTSDQHPWFQRARRAKPGTKERDFYVWSDTPDRYQDARVIFKDFETSNWAWDPVAGAYYWHRFYSHQPDLNFDNPAVRHALFRIVDFWLSMGVSGLRLDAVPYLYERQGTNCENLPETHQFLKELRRHVDERFADRMLLGEANQWPEDAVAYFGSGDECHMAFHFPIMPRLFMAIQMEDRHPITDILEQTPPIPDNAQWAMFLRNHDELTLEMVTDEERDYMYRLYARDPRARLNLGIRRRLAPLLNNDRKKVELMNALLFSMPGTPFIYYGDEIGMGDNYYLGDRNGVRTPLQWSGDRNAGFSKANPQRLYLPVIIDPEYHYEAINVEAQQNNHESLLWWMKRLIALRKRYKAFGRGKPVFLEPLNRKVLAFVMSYADETILVVANLSRQAQHAYLNLAEFAGRLPVELMGHTEFPAVGTAPYPISLGSYGFYWFSLEAKPADRFPPQVLASPEEAPLVAVRGEWRDLFEPDSRETLQSVLVRHLPRCRWFAGKARPIRSVTVADVVAVPCGESSAFVTLVEVEYTEGEPESYAVPLAFAEAQVARSMAAAFPAAVVARVTSLDGNGGGANAVSGMLVDALADPAFADTLLDAVATRRRFHGERGVMVASPSRELRDLLSNGAGALEAKPLEAEQSNSSITYGDRLILKLFRRLAEGPNPELELTRFLSGEGRFPNAPKFAGALEYQRAGDHQPVTLGTLQGLVRNKGDSWSWTLDSLGRFIEQVLAQKEVKERPLPDQPLLALAGEEPPEPVAQAAGPYLESVRLLAQRTAELHRALASDTFDPAFAPERFTMNYKRSIYQSMRNRVAEAMHWLEEKRSSLPPDAKDLAERVLRLEPEIIGLLEPVARLASSPMRIRCHGDYHLGQVLYTGSDFVIIDFEGEPARPLTERRIKRSPLTDVAGMLRSFHYAAQTALAGRVPTVVRPEDLASLDVWMRLWYFWTSAAFLGRYLEVLGPDPLLPGDPEDLRTLLMAFLLEKAHYEVAYELNNRPSWVRIPLEGIVDLVEGVPL